MKTKITYLFLILPFLTFAQGPWEFNTASNSEGWTVSQGSAGAAGILNATGTAIEYTTITGSSATSRNPTFTKTSANIDANANNQIEVRIKNGSAASYLRLTTTIGTVLNTYNCVITTADADYRIYTFTLTSSGTVSALSLEFKLNDGTTSGNNYVPQTAPSTVGTVISIDYVRPRNFVAPIQNTYNFDSTTEGFTTLTRATAVQASESSRGTLMVNCNTASVNNGKVSLSPIVFRVEGTNRYAHITLKNTSNNTLFQLNGKVASVLTAFNPVQNYTTSDANYKTYDFDLTTWDNGSQFPELNFGVKTTWLATATYEIGNIVISGNTYCKNISGANSISPAVPQTDTTNWVVCDATGAVAPAAGAILGGALNINPLTNSVYVDSIVFDNIVPLATADFGNTNNTISLYPNPAKEVLNISSSNNITKIEVYDMQGRNVVSNNNSTNVNIAAIGKGAYIVKVVQENGNIVSKQFIKE
ncbi:MAG: T9SS type A sorting domain-containing protein [Flavobacterium sp.]|nr:T9SS type A sorting domain-containing protein [Flavobacterium sp.]